MHLRRKANKTKIRCGPYASMVKLNILDKLDWLVIAHTQNLQVTVGKVDSGDDVYRSRKVRITSRKPMTVLHL